MINLKRDIHHGLTNLANIDLWALLHLSVLLVVGVTQVIFCQDDAFGFISSSLQVFMVKQLFEDDYRILN